MTRDNIIRMAREAGAGNLHGDELALFGYVALERFAKLVAAAEREACAALAEKTVCATHTPTGVRIYGIAAAKSIRARGEK